MERKGFLAKIAEAFEKTPVVVVLGPPAIGKTFLAKRFAETQGGQQEQNYFDLSNMTDLQRLAAPQVALARLTGLITLDEIQRYRNLFPVLSVLLKEPHSKQKFLILSSTDKSRLMQPLECLTGYVTYLELGALSLDQTEDIEKRWLRGGFPCSYFTESDEASWQWRDDYVRVIVERYLPNAGVRIPSQNLLRFWKMLSHYHGELFNASELGRSMGLSHNTIQGYANALTEIFMLRQLKPWHENINKRQVKSRKIYFCDVGIFNHFIGTKHISDLMMHPKLAASWEGMALNEIIYNKGVADENCFFWGTQTSAKLDLLIVKDGRRSGYLIQYSGLPKTTRTLKTVIDDLKLDELTVIHPGEDDIALCDSVRARNLHRYLEGL